MSVSLKRIISTTLIWLIFIFIIQSFVPIITNAQELNTTGFVDSFTIDKKKLLYGEQTGISVNFSDKSGNKMKSGDTLTLTLPPELKGYSGTIPLNNDQGLNFGTCQIITSNVVCIFNDTVEKLQNIKGHFNFTVQANNVETGQTKDVQTNLGTNLQAQTVTIVNPESSGTEPGQFFYKSGDIQPEKTNEIRWFLNINLKKQYVNTDIVVSDSLQEGQTLNKDSFSMEINDNTYLTIRQFQDQGYGFVQFTGDNSFKVVIYKDKANGNSFTVAYKANITESGKKQSDFYNDYTITYHALYEEPVTESSSAVVKNIAIGGGASGDLPVKGTLRIIKHIEGNEEKVIPNVSFKLYTESGKQVGDVFKTNEQGMVEVPNLTPGNYYVQEVLAPDYIDFTPEKKVSFTVDENAVNGVKLTIPNKVKSTSVTGTKTWKDNNATTRPSTIKVDLLQNGQVIDTKEVTAATNWKYMFDNLQAYDANGVAYKYEVKEQPVPGYKSEVTGYDITNTKVDQTKVEGTKTWKDDDAKGRPSTIKVNLLRNGRVIATQEVSEATGWKYTFTDLTAYGADGKAYKYEVKEQPVDGYKEEITGYDITNTKIKSAALPPTEGKKKSMFIPETGGKPTGIILTVGGVLLLVIAVLLFMRQRK
ncbi:hypothetical protein CON64_19180 [Bacillus pseudomycoides]|nr:hypothetical protein CON64_19180 [Bacillus pseudomycoides]